MLRARKKVQNNEPRRPPFYPCSQERLWRTESIARVLRVRLAGTPAKFDD